MKLLNIVLSLAVPAVVAPSAYFVYNLVTSTHNKNDFKNDDLERRSFKQRTYSIETQLQIKKAQNCKQKLDNKEQSREKLGMLVSGLYDKADRDRIEKEFVAECFTL